MKNCKALFILGLMIVLSTYSLAQNTLTANVSTISNLNFVAEQIVVKKSANTKSPFFVIIAVSKKGRIEMKINKELKEGTYTLDNKDRKTVLFFALPKGMPFTTGRCSDAIGTLTITSISNSIVKGIFSFSGKQMIAKCETAGIATVTNGKFSVKF